MTEIRGESPRELIRRAVLARDQHLLDQTLIYLSRTFSAAALEVMLRAEVATAPEEIQQWWAEPCDWCAEQIPGHTHN